MGEPGRAKEKIERKKRKMEDRIIHLKFFNLNINTSFLS
jgi:hypothetical protein